MSVKALPPQDRPRERLARYGEEGLSTIELIAIILGSGTKSRSVLQLAAEILGHFGSLKNLAEASLPELLELNGVGRTKALQLQAAFALFKRLESDPSPLSLRTPEAVYDAIRMDLEEEKTEVLMVVLRDVKRCHIHKEILGRGTLTELLVHPREVFHTAIRYRAHSAIVAHNHPSGDPTPSVQDIEITQLLISAGRVIGIELADHLIVGKNSFISLYQKGLFNRACY